MQNQLRVMEIERFAIHDGAGIRTTVFLQGCPLHCPWCCNPESQKIGSHLMYNEKKCLHCGLCARVCQNNAVTFENGHPVFHRDLCIGCRSCEKHCPGDAIKISGKIMSIEEILAIVLRDRDYYENTHGGITFSGGEPFGQFEGFWGLLKKSKENGLNTAVETTGNISSNQLLKAEPFIDTFLFDIKHTDRDKLHKVTGGNLFLILENLSLLSKIDPNKIVIRIPVIPLFNFDLKTITSIYQLAVQRNITRVDLLPYHSLGRNKYSELGLEYSLADISMISKEELVPFYNLGKSMGIRVKIGG